MKMASPVRKTIIQKKIESANWLVVALFVVVGRIFFTDDVALGILVGGLVSNANYFLLARSMRGFVNSVMRDEGAAAARKSAGIVAKNLFRLAGTGIVLYCAIVYLEVHVVGLLIGLTAVVVSIVATIVMSNMIQFLGRLRRKDASVITTR